MLRTNGTPGGTWVAHGARHAIHADCGYRPPHGTSSRRASSRIGRANGRSSGEVPEVRGIHESSGPVTSRWGSRRGPRQASPGKVRPRRLREQGLIRTAGRLALGSSVGARTPTATIVRQPVCEGTLRVQPEACPRCASERRLASIADGVFDLFRADALPALESTDQSIDMSPLEIVVRTRRSLGLRGASGKLLPGLDQSLLVARGARGRLARNRRSREDCDAPDGHCQSLVVASHRGSLLALGNTLAGRAGNGRTNGPGDEQDRRLAQQRRVHSRRFSS